MVAIVISAQYHTQWAGKSNGWKNTGPDTLPVHTSENRVIAERKNDRNILLLRIQMPEKTGKDVTIARRSMILAVNPDLDTTPKARHAIKPEAHSFPEGLSPPDSPPCQQRETE